jgi:uncharacterized paraquat-inducible protein A
MAKDVKFTDLFDPKQPRSDKDIIEQRLEICKVCPAFRPKTQRCSKCGCFMQLKATLTLAKCPIGKW